MIRKIFYTPTGKVERELTQEEIKSFAELGDEECKRELTRQNIEKASTIDEKINIILDFLGISGKKGIPN